VNTELTAPPFSRARHFDATAMHLRELLSERQPDAQSALGQRAAPIDLREHLEHTVEHGRRDADPRVADPDDRELPIALGAQRNLPARRRVLRGVVQQVLQHL